MYSKTISSWLVQPASVTPAHQHRMNLLFSGVCGNSKQRWTATAEAVCWSGSPLCTYESLECVTAPNNSTDYPSFCELLGDVSETILQFHSETLTLRVTGRS